MFAIGVATKQAQWNTSPRITRLMGYSQHCALSRRRSKPDPAPKTV
ncbi:hypothetical protein CLV47_103249 [Antricoccus suffuscus]|uniref:Uncharacterized protein n=1 Tax=Antricoccus suffuscus TaxID=1629062 RepID=A0A2T1A3K1_9ACTN|nr:hypothetical protein CLV47_103249 [Antricoccus suffuscus]